MELVRTLPWLRSDNGSLDLNMMNSTLKGQLRGAEAEVQQLLAETRSKVGQLLNVQDAYRDFRSGVSWATSS